MMPKRKKRTLNTKEDYANIRIQCARCKAIFSNDFTKCPECGSDESTGYTEINPYTTLPLESFLQACGHLFWIAGTILFLFCLWEIGETELPSEIFLILAFCLLGIGILMSALYFGLSEVISRILRLQRRLRAFHQSYTMHDGTTFTQRKRTRLRNKNSLK